MADRLLKRRIERFVSSDRHVTSARIAKAFGEDPAGAVTCAENLVVAPGLSREVAEALISLGAEGRILWSPISRTAYHLDGLFLDLPVSYVQRACDQPTWLPAAFNAPPVHRRVMEAVRLMGAVGLYPGVPDPDLGARLFEAHSHLECRMCGLCCTLSTPHNPGTPGRREALGPSRESVIREPVEVWAHLVKVKGFEA